MQIDELKSWLSSYGRAWETRDPEAAARLFAPDARYFWTPFEEPKLGRQGISTAWRDATSGQENIKFDFEIISMDDRRCISRWQCSFVRIATGKPVRLDGIFQLEFGDGGLCKELREWWHSDE